MTVRNLIQLLLLNCNLDDSVVTINQWDVPVKIEDVKKEYPDDDCVLIKIKSYE